MWLVGLGLLAVLAVAGVFAVAYASTDIPDPNEFAESQSSIIYYADGETEMARFTGGTNRESVPLSEVPDHVQEAMLSAEDRTFYENEGVSLTGTARAAWTNLTSDSTQGGSTITQQYVKNYYLTSEQSYSRKFKELMIAVKIDNELSKDEILERYLNTIYYGRGAYGTRTAAQAYFGKDVADLDVSEGAFLAAVTNAPALLDPDQAEGNQERAEERFAYVIDGMVSQGWLSEADADAAAFPDIQPPQSAEGVQGPSGYIVETVRQELVNELSISEDDIDRGGLRITSTIVQKHQEAAEKAIADGMPDSPDAADLKVGLVAITPGDGAITAMYGGADFQEQQLNNATQATAQAGSLFKVFTLIAALEGDVSTQNTFPGSSPRQFDIEGESEPAEINNFRDEQFGQIDLRTATANSVNTVFVALNEAIGPENTSRVARELGLPQDTAGLEDNLTNVLGTASPTMVQMTNAFAAIAADGELADPYIVDSVSSTNEAYDYTAEPETDQVVDPDITADVTDAMTRVIT
ncbi:MAG: transglycosylase domain-containing protein, partial [Ornithinimicrobium sp.]